MGSFVRLPSTACRVTDVDEEIFLVYTALNRPDIRLIGPDGYRGLGHIDSRKDTLAIEFELVEPVQGGPVNHDEVSKATKALKRKQTKKSRSSAVKLIEIEIAQDKTALRSRKGDTGSVAWRASVEFARAVLQQYYFPTEDAIFDHCKLSECSCLELGSGTGLLGIALSPLFRAYTATDITALLPLIRKNVSLNFEKINTGSSSQIKSLFVEELDWLTLSSLPPGPSRTRYCPRPGATATTGTDDTWDLVLVVDCVYHPSLLRPLVDTIESVSTPGRTWVFVVVELRQEDVVRDFLDRWLKSGNEDWSITRIEGLLNVNYAIWAGHRPRPIPAMDESPT
ncbi:hypothetical protein ID866_9432 [Astraeus odoratus]|nr:hypothetical protein ID866_9432 [Astraeus odoratus]